MGSFQGHAFPGTIAILFGLFWALKYSVKFLSKTATISPTQKKILSRMEFIEWASLLCLGLIGMLVEQFMDHGPGLQLYNAKEHKWIYLHIWQHTTMYAFFAIAGMVGLLTASHFHIPLGLDRLVFSLALFNEGITFYFHIAHRLPLDYHLHFMLFIALFSSAFCILLEVYFRESPILEMFRTSMIITKGTWMWQIAFVLYPRVGAPSWDQNDHENIMFTTMCFSWHYMAVILIMSAIYSIVYCFYKRQGRDFKDSAIEAKQFNKSKETYTALLNETDEE